jgi:hypothetical protein
MLNKSPWEPELKELEEEEKKCVEDFPEWFKKAKANENSNNK